MTTVVFGANGQIGRALMCYLSDAIGTFHNSTNNLCPDRQYEGLDITRGDKVEEFFSRHKPKKIFIACANIHVDGCENPDTDRVNVVGIGRLISFAKSLDAQVIFFSSSYVFDGESQTPYKTKDKTFPINRYGRQKEQIEKQMMVYEDLQYLIIRTVGVFGQDSKGLNFVAQVKRAVDTGKKICVPSDQTMNPVWSMDVAKATIHLADRYSCNIFHVAGDQCVSKYEWAIKIAYKLGCKKPHDLIVGVKTGERNVDDNGRPVANRPLNSCLDCGELSARAISIPSLDRGLEKYLTDASNSKSK